MWKWRWMVSMKWRLSRIWSMGDRVLARVSAFVFPSMNAAVGVTVTRVVLVCMSLKAFAAVNGCGFDEKMREQEAGVQVWRFLSP